MKDVEIIIFRDVFNPYFSEHTRNIYFFTVQISFRLFEDESSRKHKTNVSYNVTYDLQSEKDTTKTTDLANAFLHRFISIYLSHEFP